ncbi:phosphomannomutase/phosphoglucomutase [Campylobacter sp. RM9344]|uniref:Phosphomannomutase/phosphoglucomutase n=1 Tax=Campylobacter californiensis TaxID=1032243 RepID=A0AAW3ZR90_9BACT|nr:MULTISPECIES: phosphomannomutase/phosphoglucomutase [unclassified Campylobacter]MBE2983892.1 phosphomannomutase/phosphoglucomutase [Campylobacter sp. RM6883]MBE2994430.1 phosphomannomutase/phosphoglucomutase [Campylobacter sp. RM6913]MBE3028738.1 phosphomannomutase/phosphoglucomutase [Campylobacter sp. RM9344]MBE3607627.1 phosphomannomutase/phosphoglucomutase [Campylobacter sp. RM9337]QCD51019.1 phosphomannomutase/phosphoglucomutase [Campylobacter sp. RM6914]
MFDNIFREYDIRGIFDQDLNEASVKAIGYALGLKMKELGVKTLSVGYDARLSASELFKFLLSGLNKAGGIKIYDIGLLPTPVGYFSVYADYFDANVMITGSHNPKEYNGFKITIKKDSFFGDDLQKLKLEVNKIIDQNTRIDDDVACEKFDILTPYKEFFVKEFAGLKSFKEPFVIDCANGAIGVSVVPIINELGLNAKILYPEPDGNFPNHHPDPSEKENLEDIFRFIDGGDVKLGFGFDGDGDRIAVITPKRDIKGDELAYLYALNMQNPRVLGEVKCSQNMYDEIAKIGEVFMGKTGHSNIKKMMKELNVDLAAEVSGHIFFKERYFGFDDALYAMMRVLELVNKGFDLDGELDKMPPVFSTDEIKIKVGEEDKFKIVEELKRRIKHNECDLPKILNLIEIDGVRIQFEDGWALVRASNTTPVIVTRFEAKNEIFLNEIQEKVTDAVRLCV